jgi:rhodanese-related sulfurtransferase
MAGRLRRAGISLALPLTGGIDAWRDAGFNVAPVPAAGSERRAQ